MISIETLLSESIEVKKQFVTQNQDAIISVCNRISEALKNGNKLLLFGNGGSAADSQHMAAEFVGRFFLKRRALPAIALTTDTSILTAVANDFHYDEIFSKQIEALGNPGDIAFGISTSGNSPNVIKAMEMAKKKGLYTVSLTGGAGGKLKTFSDVNLNASLGKNSARIQETHIFCIHVICEWVEKKIFG